MASSVTSLGSLGETARESVGQSTVALFARVLLAMLFLLSGLGKVLDPAGTLAYIRAAGLPLGRVALAASALLELAGGTALILGYRTRFAAFVLAVFCVIAALTFHSDFSDQNQMIHFLKNVAIAGGLLQVAAFGAGSFGLDAHKVRRLA